MKVSMFDLKAGIKTPNDLKEVLEIAKKAKYNDERYVDAIWAIHKYKWYNWYQNLHIKKDSPEDKENTKIFLDIEINHPHIHKDIEDNIDFEINKLEDWL